MTAPFFLGLPTQDDLARAPERALLSALDAQLILTERVLELLQAQQGWPAGEPRRWLGDAIRASVSSLHTLLVAYDEVASRWADRPDQFEADALDESDLPF